MATLSAPRVVATNTLVLANLPPDAWIVPATTDSPASSSPTRQQLRVARIAAATQWITELCHRLLDAQEAPPILDALKIVVMPRLERALLLFPATSLAIRMYNILSSYQCSGGDTESELEVFYGQHWEPPTASTATLGVGGPADQALQATAQNLLQVPVTARNFLLSPPGSPPVGWVQPVESGPSQAGHSALVHSWHAAWGALHGSENWGAGAADVAQDGAFDLDHFQLDAPGPAMMPLDHVASGSSSTLNDPGPVTDDVPSIAPTALTIHFAPELPVITICAAEGDLDDAPPSNLLANARGHMPPLHATVHAQAPLPVIVPFMMGAPEWEEVPRSRVIIPQTSRPPERAAGV
jgi:hypothetical protein